MQNRKNRVQQFEHTVRNTFLAALGLIAVLIIGLLFALRHFHRLGM